MNGWRIAQILICLVFAAPFIYLNYWGFQVSAWTADVQAQNEAALRGDGHVGEISPIPESPFSFITKRIDRQKSASQTALNNNRVVAFEERLTVLPFLREGEEPPKEAFEDLYVTARAPLYFANRCEELLGTMATRCGVIRTETRRLKDGTFQVRGRLAYAPNYTVGSTDLLGGEFINTTVNAFPGARGAALPPATPQTRIAAFSTAMGLCDSLRDLYGSCVIESVRFRHVRLSEREIAESPLETDPERLDIHFRVAVYALETREEITLLEERSNEILASLN